MGSLPCWCNPCKRWIKDNIQKSIFGLHVGGATHITIILGSGRFWKFVSFEVLTLKNTARVACGERASSLSWRRKGRFVEFIGEENYIVFPLSMVRLLLLSPHCLGLFEGLRARGASESARGER